MKRSVFVSVVLCKTETSVSHMINLSWMVLAVWVGVLIFVAPLGWDNPKASIKSFFAIGCLWSSLLALWAMKGAREIARASW